MPTAKRAARAATVRGTAVTPAFHRRDQSHDRLLAILAHELRSPLTAILNSLIILRRCRVDALPARDACEIAERQARHMARIIDDVLDIARGAHGKLALHMAEVNLPAVVADAVGSVAPLITARRHLLTVALPTESLSLSADAARLQQVLVNLLTNAARYTEPGGRIWLTADATETEVVLRVRDTGIGIAPEALPDVFALFRQADPTATHAAGGLGIGLALVRQFVQMHGGSVSAYSAGLGQGSEFVVRLPRGGAGYVRGLVAEECDACI